MNWDRRTLIALAAAIPFCGHAADPDPLDLAKAWRDLFGGQGRRTFAWWFQGVMFAHVDGLREFPVLGHHAVMACRATMAPNGGAALDFRATGFFSDLASAKPATTWDNIFTGKREPIPAVFREGPGRYVMTPSAAMAVVFLTSAATRTNRVIVTGEEKEGRILLSQVEATLQGFPHLDGSLPPLTAPDVTERQTRLQLIAPVGSKTASDGFYNHVYDALPSWLGFGDRLGSGLYKGVMRRAGADERVDAAAWTYLRRTAPDAFVGDRLAPP